MEVYLQQNSSHVLADDSSSYAFSFASIAIKDHLSRGTPINEAIQEQDQELEEFEFGCITPESPTNDSDRNSPADLLFFNGRLLPHPFPFQSEKNTRSDNSRMTSRNSSIGSKGSLMSSRSNSSNSRSSSCSSARTSSSENCEKKQWNSNEVAAKTPITGERNQVNKLSPSQSYGSQRWQFITPAPILMPSNEISRRKKKESVVQEGSRLKKQAKDRTTVGSRSGGGFFRSFVSACRECHALGPSTKEDALRRNAKLQ